MKKILIGGLAALIGVAGISTFFCSFLGVIAGGLPVILIVGGALAFYLGFTEVQEAKKDKALDAEPATASPVDEEVTAPAEDAAPIAAPEVPEKDSPAKKTPKETSSEEVPVEQSQLSETEEPQSASPVEALFKGNAETLVFHRIECKFSHGKKCTAEFATRDEAVEQGYKPCKVCNP